MNKDVYKTELGFKYVSSSSHGFSMKICGPCFWLMYLSIAANVMSSYTHPHWLSFLFTRSFGSVGPCQHCCKSHRQYVHRPENDFQTLALAHKDDPVLFPRFLVRWLILIKNNVNTKLNKRILPLDAMEFSLWREPRFKFLWCDYFFNWLYYQALMFPIQMSLAARQKDATLASQYRDFVYMFTQLKYMLPFNHALSNAWNHAYYEQPPTRHVFANRDTLFEWLYRLHARIHFLMTGVVHLPYTPKEMGAMFELIRAKSCSNKKHICE